MAGIANTGAGHAHISDLALFIRGKLPDDRATRICNHIMICGKCQEDVQEITELLWPSLSIWIRCWLRFFSPSSPPSRVFGFVDRTTHRLRRSNTRDGGE